MIVCAASNNAGKLKELRRILERMGHEVKSLRELGIDLDPEETGTTFAENARIKAEAFCKVNAIRPGHSPSTSSARPSGSMKQTADTNFALRCSSGTSASSRSSFALFASSSP